MERIEKTVFISYRRTNLHCALAIYQDLTTHGYDVFFDYTGIAAGDFETAILGNIPSRAHFLVVLTPSALERCGEPNDWPRREVETALAAKRNIIPLMLEAFDFSAPPIVAQLTGKLEALRHYNGLRIPNEYFFEAMDRLRNKYLNIPLTAVLHPPSTLAKEAAAEQRVAAEAAPVVQEEQLTAEQWFERAYAAADPDEKIRLYTEAIRLKPDYAKAFNNRGAARIQNGDLEAAIRDYDEAIRLKPEFAEAFNNRGLARHQSGDFDGAIQDFGEAIYLSPGFAKALHNRARAHLRRGDFDLAIADATAAIGIQPDFADAFHNRGNSRHFLRDYAGAVEDFNEALRLKPHDAGSLVSRGSAFFKKGNHASAVADFTEAIRLRPTWANAFTNRARARQAIGDAEGAKQDLAEAARLDPSLRPA